MNKRATGVKTKKGSVNPAAGAIALKSAEAHFELGMRAYLAFHQIQCKSEKTQDDLVSGMGLAIVAACNLSFAVELFLKVAGVQDTLTFAKGHKLVGLYRGLPPKVREAVATAYDKVRREDHNPYCAVGTWEPSAAASIEKVLQGADSAYETWRYIFEQMTPRALRFHFGGIICAAKALRHHIQNHGRTFEIVWKR